MENFIDQMIADSVEVEQSQEYKELIDEHTAEQKYIRSVTEVFECELEQIAQKNRG